MEEEKLTPSEIEAIARLSANWKYDLEDLKYIGKFEGLSLELKYTSPEPGRGFPYSGGDPYYYISLKVYSEKDNVGSERYTNDPQSGDSKNRYLEEMLDRAIREASKERQERISATIERVRKTITKK